MSIIYDALQKTQKNRENRQNMPRKKININSRWIDIGLMLIITFLICLAVSAYLPHIKTFIAHFSQPTKKIAQVKPIPSEPLINITQYKNQHILSGVFISTEEKAALINNRIFHIGDNLDGFKIVGINNNSVQLANHQQTIELKVAS